MNLDEVQLECVRSPIEQHLYILAGPGSGKTATMIHRVKYLIDNDIEPQSIIMNTFTRKAADEMRSRLEKLIGTARAREVKCNTFHSIGMQLMRRVMDYEDLPTIVDDSEKRDFFKELLSNNEKTNNRCKIHQQLLETKRQRGNATYKIAGDACTNAAKLMSKLYEEAYCQYPPATVFETIYGFNSGEINNMFGLYNQHKAISKLMDFSDVLYWWIENIHLSPHINQLIVDEMQDCNDVQYYLINQYRKRGTVVTVVGDDAQSIYGFRGGNVSLIRNFPENYNGIVVKKLTNNYRSTKPIVDFCNHLLSANGECIQKPMVSMHGETDIDNLPHFYMFDGYDLDMMRQISDTCTTELQSGRSCAVLSRFNKSINIFEAMLVQRAIPCKLLKSKSLMDNKYVKCFLYAISLVFMPLCSRDSENDKLLRLLPTIGPVNAKRINNAVNTQLQVKRALEPEVKFSWVCAFVELPDENEYVKKLQQLFKECLERVRAPDYRFEDVGPACAEALFAELKSYLVDQSKSPAPAYYFTALIEAMRLFPNFEQFINDSRVHGITVPNNEQVVAEMTSTLFADNQMVTLGSVHSAKGLEFDTVIVADTHSYTYSSGEEKRVLFVACSRARSKLHIVYNTHGESNYNGEWLRRKFVSMMHPNIVTPGNEQAQTYIQSLQLQ